MTRHALAISALALSAATAFASSNSADGTFDRTLTLSGAPNVSISNGSGYLHVSAGQDNQVHVVGHVRANTGWFGPDADTRVHQIVSSPPIDQSGNTVHIGAPHADSDLYRNVSIDYDITLPRSTTLKAETGSGGLEINAVEGSVTAGSGSGTIRASSLHGPVNLHTGSGNIELSLNAAGDVHAQTGSGAIRIEGAASGVQATTGSGAIEVAGNPAFEWRLQTGSGAIRLRLPDSAHFNLDADTGSGTVQVDRPIMMRGSLNKHHVSGSVNGGGPTIRAQTGSGGISVH